MLCIFKSTQHKCFVFLKACNINPLPHGGILYPIPRRRVTIDRTQRGQSYCLLRFGIYSGKRGGGTHRVIGHVTQASSAERCVRSVYPYPMPWTRRKHTQYTRAGHSLFISRFALRSFHFHGSLSL